MSAMKKPVRLEGCAFVPGLRRPHNLILNNEDRVCVAIPEERNPCRFSSMFASSASTNSRPSSTASKKQNVPSATARNCLHNSRPSQCPPKAAQACRHPVPAAHAEIPEGQGPAAAEDLTKLELEKELTDYQRGGSLCDLRGLLLHP